MGTVTRDNKGSRKYCKGFAPKLIALTFQNERARVIVSAVVIDEAMRWNV